MNNPTVSVVIPLFNKGKYIERALDSVFNQKYSPLEIIVVDDGSTDDGPDRVRRFDSSRVTLIRQKNKGPGAARNQGLAIAKGEYIAFLDADDEWLPNFLYRGISYIKEKKVPIVCTNYYRFPSMKTNTEIFGNLNISIFKIDEYKDITSIIRLLNNMWTCSTIFKTSTIQKYDGFFDRYQCLIGEDRYLFIKLIFNECIGIINEPLAIYHTEASTCSRVMGIEPFISEFSELFSVCQENRKTLLRKLILELSLSRLKKNIVCGHADMANDLIVFLHDNAFISNTKAKFFKFFILLSPTFSTLGSIMKRLLTQKCQA